VVADAAADALGGGRFNWTAVELRDQIGTELKAITRSRASIRRLGLTFQWHPRVNVYGSYGESSRVPSPSS
jgi:outer membrane receptor protein involved in Fe transport